MSASRGKGSGLEWFIRRGSAVRGPFSSTRVRHFVLEGKLGLDDEVSADRTDWRRLGSVAEVVPLQMRAHDPALDAVDDDSAGRGRALRSMLVVGLLVVGLTVTVYLIGDRNDAPVIDCAAEPQPGGVFDGCRLNGVVWRSAALGGASLANTVLADALLSEADLSNADMRYVDLSGADLSYARVDGANLKGANLRLADLTNADLRGADLSFADLSRSRIGGARLDGALLQGAIWTDGRRCDLNDCPR
jgi:hypothetical protein